MFYDPGTVCRALVQFYDSSSGRMRFKSRPALIIGNADEQDYTVLPISTITKRQNMNPHFDVPIDPKQYPGLTLAKYCFVRTHKPTIINAGQISPPVADMKNTYEELFLEILTRYEEYNSQIIALALN